MASETPLLPKEQPLRKECFTFDKIFGACTNKAASERLLPTIVMGQVYFDGAPLESSELGLVMTERFTKIWRFRALLRYSKPGQEPTTTGKWWHNIHWEELPIKSVDPAWHVVEVTGKKSRKDVDDFQSELYKNHGGLTVEKPLWKIYILNGVEHPRLDGKTTNLMLVVIDHTIADGISLVQAFLSATDEGREKLASTVVKSVRTGSASSKPVLGCFGRMAAWFCGCWRTSFGACLPADSLNRLKIKDHRNPTKGKVCASCGQIDLDRVKEVKNKFPGSTVNDVLLGVMTATLKAYYTEQQDSVTKPGCCGAKVRGAFLVNMRSPDVDILSDESFGNQFTTGHFNFPLNFPNYESLVPCIQRQTEGLKGSPEFIIRRGQAGVLENCARNHDMLADLILDDYGKVTGILSNVAGPQKQVSINNRKVDDLSFYAFAPIGLYFGILTYNGKVNGSVSLDPTCDTNAGALAKHFAPEFDKLYASVMKADKPLA